MKKETKAKLIKELKNEKGEKRNITFSLESTLLDEFKEQCDRYGLKMNTVIEKMIRNFVNDD